MGSLFLNGKSRIWNTSAFIAPGSLLTKQHPFRALLYGCDCRYGLSVTACCSPIALTNGFHIDHRAKRCLVFFRAYPGAAFYPTGPICRRLPLHKNDTVRQVVRANDYKNHQVFTTKYAINQRQWTFLKVLCEGRWIEIILRKSRWFFCKSGRWLQFPETEAFCFFDLVGKVQTEPKTIVRKNWKIQGKGERPRRETTGESKRMKTERRGGREKEEERRREGGKKGGRRGERSKGSTISARRGPAAFVVVESDDRWMA